MFRFEHPEFLVAFLAVPVLLLLYLGYRWYQRNTLKKFAVLKAQRRLLSDWSKRKSLIRICVILLAFAMLAAALPNPQWGFRKEKVESKSADIFVALDISNSMLAQDIPPSRLERAKKFAMDLVDELKGERIGLILFAGNAYLQMPLTTDYAAAQLFIKSAHPGLATSQGTAIGDVLDLAMRAYEENDVRHKALILITDGENHDDEALTKMEAGRDLGLVPFVIGVGTTEGGFIPIEIQGREDYKRDKQGNPVKTQMNEQFMRDLARAGNGDVFSIFNSKEVILNLEQRIDQLEKQEMQEMAFKDYESYFQYFLFFGLFLIVVEFVMSEKKSKWLRKQTWFEVN